MISQEGPAHEVAVIIVLHYACECEIGWHAQSNKSQTVCVCRYMLERTLLGYWY